MKRMPFHLGNELVRQERLEEGVRHLEQAAQLLPDSALVLGGLGEGDVAVDLGSNIGMYTITMAVRAGASGKVIAIDPSRR